MKIELEKFAQELLGNIDNHPEDFFTRAEIEELTGWSHGKVFDYIRTGKLDACKVPYPTSIGFQWHIAKSSFRSLILTGIEVGRKARGEFTKEEKINRSYKNLLEQIFSKKKRKGLVSNGQESSLHSEIKQAVLAALLSSGLEDTSTEYHLKLKRNYYLDVVGFKDDKLIAVECGDINSDKQSDFWNFFADSNKAELYWLPFNSGSLLRIEPMKQSFGNFLQFKNYSKSHKHR